MSNSISTSKILQFEGELPIRAFIEALKVYEEQGYVSCAVDLTFRYKGAEGQPGIVMYKSHPGSAEELVEG